MGPRLRSWWKNVTAQPSFLVQGAGKIAGPDGEGNLLLTRLARWLRDNDIAVDTADQRGVLADGQRFADQIALDG